MNPELPVASHYCFRALGGRYGVRCFPAEPVVGRYKFLTKPANALWLARCYVSPSHVLFSPKRESKKSRARRLEAEARAENDDYVDDTPTEKEISEQEAKKEKEKAIKLRQDLEDLAEQLKPGHFWTKSLPPRVLVIHPYVKFIKGISPEARELPTLRLKEAVSLVESMAWPVVEAKTQSFSGKRKVLTFFGSGKFEEIKQEIGDKKVDILFVDTEQLSPTQIRNMSIELNCKVLDRFRLILEIFSQRAETNESKLQVELASLPYRRAHLSVLIEATVMAQQRSGGAFMSGSGETQLEIERRTLADLETKIKRELDIIAKTRAMHLSARKSSGKPTFAIVGYTNAGKSALLNSLSGSSLVSHDMLFASLHTHVRKVTLPSGNTALGTDTVGFISNLPHRLVAPFRSTLEEVSAADIVLHVRDITNVETERQRRSVRQVLDDVYTQYGMDASEVEIEVWNKRDLLPKKALRQLKAKAKEEQAFLISAQTGRGVDKLLKKMDQLFLEKYPHMRRAYDIVLPEGDDNMRLLQYLYEHGRVKNIVHDDGEDGDNKQMMVSVQMADHHYQAFLELQQLGGSRMTI